MSKIIFLPLLSIILFYGCNSFPVYRLHTIEHPDDIYMGMETVKRSDWNIEMLLQFERQTGKNYEFFISIRNNSSRSFVFTPKEIYSVMVKGNNENFTKRFYAIDPEEHLKKIDSEINHNIASKKTTDGINGFIAFLDIASTIATIGTNKSAEQLQQEEENREEFHQAVQDEEINYQNKMASLKDQKNYWENEILRTTKYFPQDKIGGTFFIPVIEDAEIVKVVIPILGRNYEFMFKQSCSE